MGVAERELGVCEAVLVGAGAEGESQMTVRQVEDGDDFGGDREEILGRVPSAVRESTT